MKDPKSRWENLDKSHVLYSADLIAARFGPGKVHHVPGHQGIEMALVRLYRATGERRYLELCKFFLDRLWQDVVGRKLYITGASATAQYYDEGFGAPYHLPNDTAYGETCGTISTVFWSHRMALLHEDAHYIDVLERALYNGVLSGISLSGDKFFYKNPLASRGKVDRDESWNPACCQSNLVRVIPQVGALAYATDADTTIKDSIRGKRYRAALGENTLEKILFPQDPK